MLTSLLTWSIWQCLSLRYFLLSISESDQPNIFLKHLKLHACFARTTLPSDKDTLVLVVISHGSVSNIGNSKSVLNKQHLFETCTRKGLY